MIFANNLILEYIYNGAIESTRKYLIYYLRIVI